MFPFVDHLVYAAPDLADGIAIVERLFGCPVVPGGRHENWGTRNALVSLGDTCYLEIIGPDLQPLIDGDAALFGIDTLEEPRLVTWAAKSSDLEAGIERASSAGVDLGAVFPGRRALPNRAVLSWRLTDPFAARAEGAVPFLIDWGDSRHPAAMLPRACELVDLRITHLDVPLVGAALDAIGVPLDVIAGEAGFTATIRTPNGIVELS